MARELVLVRHGETEWNRAGRLQGHADSPLTDRGRRQAAAHLDWLRDAAPGIVFTSPLGRARATAAILAGGLGVPTIVDARLRERSIGEFEGWTLEALRRDRPEAWAAREADRWRWRPDGGEDHEAVLARVAPLVAELRRHPAERVLVVGHGSLARPFLKALLGLDHAAAVGLAMPNDLAYRVDLATDRVTHVQDGRVGDGLFFGADAGMAPEAPAP